MINLPLNARSAYEMPGADVHDSSNGVSIDKYPVHVNVIPGIFVYTPDSEENSCTPADRGDR